MKCEVLQKTDSIDKALDILSDLPGPVCLAILEDKSTNGDIGKIYQDIIDKASRKIAIMGKGVAVWIAADMIRSGRNVICRMDNETCPPYKLRETIHELRVNIDNKPHSLVGVYIESANPTNSASYGSYLNVITNDFDCFIRITP